MEFSLRVSSGGLGTVSGVTVRDTLPAGLTYTPGSTTIDGATAADGIVSTGLTLGAMAPTRAITVRFRATVAPVAFFSLGTSVLTNTGFVRSSSTPEVSDVAFVSVLNNPQPLNISLTKMGRNSSRGETGEHSSVRAAPGHQVAFVMHVRNTSSAAVTGVILRDILPQEITMVAGSVRIGGSTADDSLISGGLALGTLAPAQEVVVGFSGKVTQSSALPSGTTTVLNTATVVAAGIPTLSVQMPIVITNGGVVVPPVETGPGDATAMALVVSALITLLYVGYTGTATYRRHEAGGLADDSRTEPLDFRT